jgi:hypothetical protein
VWGGADHAIESTAVREDAVHAHKGHSCGE